jgi:hypothetical protein
MKVQWSDRLKTFHNRNVSTVITPVKIISLALIALDCLVLTHWLFNIPVLKSILPNFADIKPNIALSFLLTGFVLWLLQEPLTLTRKRFAQIGILLIFCWGF